MLGTTATRNVREDGLAASKRVVSKTDASVDQDPGGGSGHGIRTGRREEAISISLVFFITLLANHSVGATRRKQQVAHASTFLFRS